VLVPVVWMGLEYFRCELYYLKFAWLVPGMAMPFYPATLGVYGTGFAMMTVAAVQSCFSWRDLWQRLSWFELLIWIFLGLMILAIMLPSHSEARDHSGPPGARVVGIQLEQPSTTEILDALDTVVSVHPDVQLIVMSEYTLIRPPTAAITTWCRRHQRYLILGGVQRGEELWGDTEVWADTAFVIDPQGEIVFAQGKCVPIQFLQDGVAAKEQGVWDSPWGKIGICICYDLSYTRVVDELVRQGAQYLVVPAMDATYWGAYEHELHARIAPLRAAEYHIPIIRVASSGVSQIVSAYGGTMANAPYPGQGEMVTARMLYPADRSGHGRLPWDRYAAPVCVGLTGLVIIRLLAWRVQQMFAGRTRRRASAEPAQIHGTL
jgi:apolipoprotein N-acyltransferase